MKLSLRVRLTAGLLAVALVASAASALIGRAMALGHLSSYALVASFVGLFVIFVSVSVALATFFERSAKRAFQRLQAQSEVEDVQLVSVSRLNSELHEQNAIQSAAATETSAAVHELQETVQKNNETAKQARASSEASRIAAENGQRSVVNMTEAFTQLSDTARKLVDGLKGSSSNLDELVTLIGQISEKTKAIDEIVFQTRILSFNASVEAARAGEHGRGFAVVAEEVGSLAQMSGRAAAEISSILRLGVDKAKAVSEAVRSSADNLVVETKNSSDVGLGRSEECRSALTGILQSVEQVNQAIDTVSRSTEEQTIGIGEIAKAIMQIESANMKTAHVVSEIESGLEKVRGAEQERVAIVRDLRELLLGAEMSPVASVAPLVKAPSPPLATQPALVAKPRVVPIPKAKTRPTAKALISIPKLDRAAVNKQKKVVGMDYPDASDSRFEEV
jgi:methyl-accepting chemotaxis protein